MKGKILFLLISIIFVSNSNAQKKYLQSGPMVGYSEMKEVMLWVQTNENAEVKIKYFNTNNPKEIYETNTVETEMDKAYTAHLIANNLEPGQVYNYDLYINNKKIELPYETNFQTLTLWQYRTNPPDFMFAAGSCAFINEEKYDRPGKPYGGDYQVFESIHKMNPDFMIWLGDNTYFREPDWNSVTGQHHRYTHTRSIKEMQALLASTHNYAIWDDHDYGPNDSDRGFHMKNESLNTFKLFWANPTYGIGDLKGAITFFTWGDCDFFMLDNRFYKTPNYRDDCEKTILGKEQLEWLKDALVYSQASFKFVVIGGQFLTPTGFYEQFSNGYAKERAEIIEYIHNENIMNVIFLTGDRHHSEISYLKRGRKPGIYDITSSPLTSSHAELKKNEINPLRVENKIINERNFTTIKIEGKLNNRKAAVTFYDVNGKELFQYIINQESYRNK